MVKDQWNRNALDTLYEAYTEGADRGIVLFKTLIITNDHENILEELKQIIAYLEKHKEDYDMLFENSSKTIKKILEDLPDPEK